MAKEIERKFIINQHHPEIIEILKTAPHTHMFQGYLNTDPNRTVRVRIQGHLALLTVKGKQQGITRPEFEYEIPYEDAEAMYELCTAKVEKIRTYHKLNDQLTWEIDIFYENNKGLALAEIELTDENQEIELPEWIVKEVSTNYKFTNANLALHPFNTWSANELAEDYPMSTLYNIAIDNKKIDSFLNLKGS